MGAARLTPYNDGVGTIVSDPLERKVLADLALERAADRLRELLRDAALELRPFPPFPGAFFTNAVEVEAPGMNDPALGCVVVREDGELCELKMSINFDETTPDPVQARDETLVPLTDLHPRDYVVYAYAALMRITELLLERAGDAPA